ncbi:MAG: hypothetical protein M3Y57_12515, partial [Acidobacteriota bacterium]|nr:hypothetical protein [Acidobacteriota bacterium]
MNLYSVADARERAQGQFFVQQTFGESTVQLSGEGSRERIAFSEISRMLIPFPAQGPAVYAVHLEYRSPVPISVTVWDVDENFRKLDEITLFNETAPESASRFTAFENSFVIPALRGKSAAVVLSLPDKSGQLSDVNVRAIQVFRIATRKEPYHRLNMGHPEEKTAFIFADDRVPDTVRGYRLASEIHLTEALGFQGGETEKVLYADLMMLCWNAELENFRPMLAPSIWYSAAGEMYLRDSFFALNGIHNRELNEKVFQLWADNQGGDGAINTLVEPNMANLERKTNDSTPLWLMWALLNRRRFGTRLPVDKVKKAAEYCLA